MNAEDALRLPAFLVRFDGVLKIRARTAEEAATVADEWAQSVPCVVPVTRCQLHTCGPYRIVARKLNQGS